MQRRGEPASSFFIISAGSVAVKAGAGVAEATRGAGDFVGEAALLGAGQVGGWAAGWGAFGMPSAGCRERTSKQGRCQLAMR